MSGVHRLPLDSGLILENHGVGSTDHFQEPAVLTMIHYCFHSHFIYLDK